jgi:glycine dehydrogenase subunit 1
MGPQGLREAALLGAERAHELQEALAESGLQPRFGGAFLNEFVLRMPGDAEATVRALCDAGWLVGPELGRDYPELSDCVLVAATERRTSEEIAGLAEALQRAARSED